MANKIRTFNQLLFEVRNLIDYDSIDYRLYFNKYENTHIKIFNTHNHIIDDKGFKVKFNEKNHNFTIYYGRELDDDCYVYKHTETVTSLERIYNIIKAIKGVEDEE